MNLIVGPIMPKVIDVTVETLLKIFGVSVILGAVVLATVLIAKYALKRWGGEKVKTIAGFVGIGLGVTVALLCFFGCTTMTVRGILFSLILLLASFSDIKSRECDDWLHVMIVIVAFVGFELSSIPSMLLSAFVISLLMILSIFIGKGRIGGADIKFCIASSLVLGLKGSVIGLTLGLVLAILMNIKRNKKEGFPLVPYLATGFMVAYFI